MHSYIILGTLSEEGLTAMVNAPEAFPKALVALEDDDVKVKTHWVTAGDTDMVLVIEARDLTKALAFAAALSATGLRTTTLPAVNADGIDALMRDAKTKIEALN